MKTLQHRRQERRHYELPPRPPIPDRRNNLFLKPSDLDFDIQISAIGKARQHIFQAWHLLVRIPAFTTLVPWFRGLQSFVY